MKEYTQIIVEKVKFRECICSYLRRHDVSDRYLSKLRKQPGYIMLNSVVANTASRLKNGDVILINNEPEKEKTTINPCSLALDVVYEDDYLILINKPSGLATMPTKSHFNDNLCGALVYYFNQKNEEFVCRVINRLDKEVNGLVLIAKNAFCASYFDAHQQLIKKTYSALLNGKIMAKTIVNSPIETLVGENGENIIKRVISPNGKPAQTTINPIKYYAKNNFTLCDVFIEHGRTHQIRLHSSSTGHPIVGDKLYGEEDGKASRVMLMCKSMQFPHPITHKILSYTLKLDSDFIKLAQG